MADAAQVVRLSVCQLRRLRRRLEAKGRGALQHGNRERPTANRLSPAVQARIVRLRREKYAGFNDLHFVEMSTGSLADRAAARLPSLLPAHAARGRGERRTRLDSCGVSTRGRLDGGARSGISGASLWPLVAKLSLTFVLINIGAHRVEGGARSRIREPPSGRWSRSSREPSS